MTCVGVVGFTPVVNDGILSLLKDSDREAGHLLGVWLVALGVLALSTARPAYSPLLHPLGDPFVFIGLFGLVVLGAASSRFRDMAVGMPMSVCGGLVVCSVTRSLLTESVALTGRTALTAGGLVVLGGLFAREGVVIARGRRHRARDSSPPTRWQWWLGAVVLLAAGLAGVL